MIFSKHVTDWYSVKHSVLLDLPEGAAYHPPEL